MRKILILDDSNDLLFTLKGLISFYNFEARTAINTKEFVIEIDKFHPDILLIDVKLNGSDGREVCKYLREHTQYNNLPIILVSGSPDMLEDFREYGADGVIGKPFDITDLVEKLNNALAARGRMK